jgi:hypothetical protein
MNRSRLAWVCSTLIVLSSGSAFSRESPIVVNNGGGISENNILYAWLNLPVFVSTCLESVDCGLSPPERNLLSKISKVLSSEQSGLGIQFRSATSSPGLFELDEQGQPRSAVTGDNIGDPIYFNLDRLYPIIEGSRRAFEVMDAVALLVHELGHHHGVKDHAWLDRIGSLVKKANLVAREEIHLGRYGHEHQKFSAYNPGFDIYSLSSFVRRPVKLLYSNDFEVIDLTPPLQATLKCTATGKVPDQIIVQNLHWTRLDPYEKSSQIQILKFKAVVDWKCGPPAFGLDEEFHNADLEFAANFTPRWLVDWGPESRLVPYTMESWTNQDKAVLEIQPATIRFKIENCTSFDRSRKPLGDCGF